MSKYTYTVKSITNETTLGVFDSAPKATHFVEHHLDCGWDYTDLIEFRQDMNRRVWSLDDVIFCGACETIQVIRA